MNLRKRKDFSPSSTRNEEIGLEAEVRTIPEVGPIQYNLTRCEKEMNSAETAERKAPYTEA
jgi:hypothetical protein